MRASNGQRSIAMDDAMRYLKASHFNASRAIEMYKNYEVTRSSFFPVGVASGSKKGSL